MLNANLATSRLGTWTENSIKFKLKISKRWKRKPNEKEVGMKWEAKWICCRLFSMIKKFLTIFNS